MYKLKNKIPIILISCLAAFFLLLSACNSDSSSSTANLKGNVTITFNRAVVSTSHTGRQLAANYSGTDTAVTFQWNRDGTPITSGGTGALYTPREPGSYTVTARASGYNPKTSAAVNVTIAPILILKGNVTITLDGNVVTESQTGQELTAVYSETDAAVTFQWNRYGIPVTPGGTGEVFTPEEPGSYTVTARASGYNPKSSADVTVASASHLTLNGNVTITLNSAVVSTAPTGRQLTATYSGTDTAVTFHWNKDGTAVSDGETYTPDEPGTFTVTASAENYNPETSDAVTVVWAYLLPCDLPNHFAFDVSNSHAELLYSGCYDAIHRGPHRVEYILTKERVQAPSVTRPSVQFRNDRDGGVLQNLIQSHIPGFTLPTHSTYTGSGYDRGHMAPNGDFNDTEENATLTFFTGNIWPQTPHCNQVTWLATENKTRTLAVEYTTIKVILIVDEFSDKTVGPIQVPSNFKRRVFDIASDELIYEIDIDNDF